MGQSQTGDSAGGLESAGAARSSGGLAIAADLPAEARLALVLMSGMPTAFAGLILAEEYDLDRELTASSVALSTGALLITIPLWLTLFGQAS